MSERSWKFILVGSVVLNVFMLGAIGGGAYQWFATHRDEHAAGGSAQRTALRFAADELPDARQRAFVAALKAARKDGRDFAREGRDGRITVLDLLAAPQLDRAAIDAALDRTRAADSALRAQVERSVVDFAATLTADERAKFVDGLRRSGNWRLPAKKRGAPESP
ncbi:TPA: periplasmic heavy metal sensor [Burkholderia cenocepacia]|uniref:periplasmic heavy metal sensor n=1 Tax=unclassified Burkholderia TaxID=2613784 RepID=UPI001588A1A8|nr:MULTISPECIES: periplasmic heavy metal sensor [unclassified Burkholderia]HEF5869660.1 periplasmic heavy metal sensor [Burkholderia cenocepacia]